MSAANLSETPRLPYPYTFLCRSSTSKQNTDGSDLLQVAASTSADNAQLLPHIRRCAINLCAPFAKNISLKTTLPAMANGFSTYPSMTILALTLCQKDLVHYN